MKERVVVTGMGAITPIGNSVNDFWQGIKENKIGFAKVTHFDASEYKASLAAEVKDFNAKDYMDPRSAAGWSCSASMRSRRRKRRWKMPDWI